jgi:hypothetical protein
MLFDGLVGVHMDLHRVSPVVHQVRTILLLL